MEVKSFSLLTGALQSRGEPKCRKNAKQRQLFIKVLKVCQWVVIQIHPATARTLVILTRPKTKISLTLLVYRTWSRFCCKKDVRQIRSSTCFVTISPTALNEQSHFSLWLWKSGIYHEHGWLNTMQQTLKLILRSFNFDTAMNDF